MQIGASRTNEAGRLPTPALATFYSAFGSTAVAVVLCKTVLAGTGHCKMSSGGSVRAQVAETLRDTLSHLSAGSIQLPRDLVCIPSSLPTIEAFKVHTRTHTQTSTIHTATLLLRFSANRSSFLRPYTKRAVPISLDSLTRATSSHSVYLLVRPCIRSCVTKLILNRM